MTRHLYPSRSNGYSRHLISRPRDPTGRILPSRLSYRTGLTFGEDPRMDLSVTLSLLVFVGGFLFITFEMARWADGDCRSLIAVWAGENGLTVLRCHRCCLISPVFPPSEDRVLY